jgi:hypothetical protein
VDANIDAFNKSRTTVTTDETVTADDIVEAITKMTDPQT